MTPPPPRWLSLPRAAISQAWRVAAAVNAGSTVTAPSPAWARIWLTEDAIA
nr:hypothetical protein [Paracoccus sp. NBH48]